VLAAELKLVPGRHGCKLEQRAVAARIPIAKLGALLVPIHVQQAELHALIEPGTAEDQLAQPVDERLAVDGRQRLPVPDEIAAELASRLVDPLVGRELDEISGLVLVEIVAFDESELHRRADHAFLEILGVESEPVAEKLDHVVVAGLVVHLAHAPEDTQRGCRPKPSLRLSSAMHEATWTITSCPHRESAELARELGISETTARVLIRRGYADAATARSFLAGADPGHDPRLLGDMDAACERIRTAIASKTRICVHGDYDADGICATALAVLVLRELGADVSWHLPSRFDEGYGVAGETLTRLAEEGCGLVLTVDCGITAAAEVRRAKELGLDVVVTDHHRPGDELPDCPIVATRPSEYPFPELCGTGVVYKLGQALLGREAEELRRHLDLVAIATISDVVPLLDENRHLAREGLLALARTQKPGLRSLMRSAGVDPAAVDAGAVGFRLAPRINAAGRLSHPETALTLLLTDDDDEAAQLTRRLEELNRERQAVEDRILRDAVAQIEAWPESRRRRRGYVVVGEEWHEGVIGIVASRLVERFHRPVVLIAGTDGDWKGSGRSIPSFDLHGALGACSEHLSRFGGHRAAAGLSIEPARLGAFAEAFAAEADSELPEEALQPTIGVDAVVSGDELTLDLCSELANLAPFGLGNPGVTLLLPSCALSDVAPTADGRHLRFRVRHRNRPAGAAIAFGLGGRADSARRELPHDVLFRLEANRWNGTVAPQLVVRQLLATPERYEGLRDWLASELRKATDDRDAVSQAIFDELGVEVGGPTRQLLESDTFRALLTAEPASVAEAA
jgi:single-stranded-DNA-specific exonuclease RecJ